MQIIQIYSIWDRKAAYYLPLMQHRSDTDAMREFTGLVMNPDTPISQYPADFDLLRMGAFAVEDGTLVPETHPVPIVNGLVCLQNAHQERRRYEALLQHGQVPEPAVEASEASANGASS